MKLSNTCLVVFLLLLAGVKVSTAQHFSIKHYTTEDGLASNSLYSAFADSKGYLWLCSDKGLMQYNGFTFKTYTTSDGLPDNESFFLREDGEGRLWLATFNGKLCFYKDGVFHSGANAPWLKLPFKDSPYTMSFVEKDGSITSIFENGDAIINIKKEKIAYTRIPESLRDGEYIFFSKISESCYRLIQTQQDVVIDTAGHIISQTSLSLKGYILAASTRSASFFYTRKGLYDFGERLIHPLSHLPFDSIGIRLMIDKDNSYWIGKGNGLYIRDSIYCLKGKYISTILRDTAGTYWVSTRDDGLYQFSRYPFDLLKYESQYTESIIQAVSTKDGIIFANSYGDLFRFSRGKTELLARSTIARTKISEMVKGQIAIIDKENYFEAQHRSRSLQIVLNGKEIRKNTTTYNPFFIKGLMATDHYLYLFGINSIHRKAYGDIAGSETADVVLPPGYNRAGRIFARAFNKADNSIWFNRADGMFALRDTQIVRKKRFDSLIFKQFLFLDRYLIGFTDKNEFLVCGNYDGNMVSSALPKENCIWDWIYPIDGNRALISTNNQYRVLTLLPAAQDGKPRYVIQTLENSFIPLQTEYFVTDSTHAYFFAKGAITKTPIAILFDKTPPPVPIFISLKAGKQTYPIAGEVTLSYKQSGNINIAFDNISFISKELKREYSISRDGLDNWQEINSNEINLNTPGFGTYQVKVRIKTLNSDFSKPAVMTLIIQKPYWATWWFISLSILALAAMVWCIVLVLTWRKLKKKQKDHEADMKYQQSEYKALNALMNPHFIFNSLNNIQGLINKDEKRIANEYLVIFSDLVRQNMHNISRGFISLQQELNLVENYLTLEKLRFKELINYELQVDDTVDTEDILIPPLMIQPLVENAVKHGLLPRQSADSMVRIHVYEKSNLLFIEINDNGIGLTQSLKSKNRLHESFGLVNLRKRTEHLKKIQQQEIDIEIKETKDSNGNVNGTTAIIKMDLKEN